MNESVRLLNWMLLFLQRDFILNYNKVIFLILFLQSELSTSFQVDRYFLPLFLLKIPIIVLVVNRAGNKARLIPPATVSTETSHTLSATLNGSCTTNGNSSNTFTGGLGAFFKNKLGSLVTDGFGGLGLVCDEVLIDKNANGDFSVSVSVGEGMAIR